MASVKEKRFAVIDTETCDLKGIVYDFAFGICDKKGNTYHAENYLVKEVFTDPVKMMGAYYAKKVFSDYVPLLDKSELRLKPWEFIRAQFLEVCRFYEVDVLCAYNLKFDSRAMGETQKLLSEGKFLTFKPDLLCIWEFACQTIFQQRNYKEIANHYGWRSEAGNYKTTAEHAYKYCFDPDFQEKHTALEDVNAEIAILADCFRQKKKVPYNVLNGKTWRQVQ